MRIIGGLRRGHTIQSPSDSRTRPTSDKVRESIFNILGPAIEDRVVLDLFAGSGAMGLEALSRGAARAIFIDRRGPNLSVIRKNLATLRFEGIGEIVQANVYSWIEAFRPEGDEPVIVFLDPPYRDYDLATLKLRRLLRTLADRLPDGSILVAETGPELNRIVFPETEAWDIRRYGDTQVALLTISRSESPH